MRQPPDRLRARPTPETGPRNVQVTGTALDSLRLHAPADAVPDPADVAALVEQSAERDTWQRVALARERAAYLRGRADGIDIGRRHAEEEQARAWRAIAHSVAAGGTPYAELERRRHMLWGEQRTRETFGQPHRLDRTPREAA